jgi:puromycin-sensitive aminopeptidase
VAQRRKTSSKGKKSARKRAPARGAAAKRAASKRTTTTRVSTRKSAKPKSPATPQRVRPFRLSTDVTPGDVDVAVTVDPARSSAFRGEVGIDLEMKGRRRAIELHCADLKVRRARLQLGERTLRGECELHPERETVRIRFDEQIPEGAGRLEIAFSGRLRKDLCGLYEAVVGERQYAFTQLEAADARKFFPCFDEPAMKARFQMTVTTADINTVVSNSPEAHTQDNGDGTKTVRFERTPLLSSYLVALAVGELECGEPEYAGDTEIRVYHTPGKMHLTGFSLQAARETLTRLEKYFDLPYPYAKLDLVAVPDFEFGAMENAGAVFFRETLLLLDPHDATLAERKRAAEVICHELAHMWYGNLVTMAWWDDLWLNEAFATWMAFAIVADWKPEWKMWQDFQHHRTMAFDLDALKHTHPIYCKVKTPDDANANFDAITYEKGASVVRMLERYIGAKAFRSGVRTYVRRHQESNTVAADLWNALSEASGEPIEAMAREWIEQEGYPSIGVRRVEGAIELVQNRFLEQPAKPGAARSEKARWPVPWVGRVGQAGGATRTVRHLLKKRRDRVPIDGAASFVYGNADEGGFFRPRHDEAELNALVKALPALSTVERMGLVDHQWASTRSGESPLGSLLDLLGSLADEPDADVLATMRRPLALLCERLAPDAGRDSDEQLRAWIEKRFGPPCTELGWESKRGENDGIRLRRATLLSIVGGLSRSQKVLDEASEHCGRYLEDQRAVEPNLADTTVLLAASVGDAQLHDAFADAMREARTPQEQRRFLLALADFSDPRLIERTLAMSLGSDVPTQDVVFLLVRMLSNPAAAQRTWRFVTERWPRLQRRLPSLLAGRLISATPALGPDHRKQVAEFFRANPVPSGARNLRQALERFDWYAGFQRRSVPQLRAYLER